MPPPYQVTNTIRAMGPDLDTVLGDLRLHVSRGERGLPGPRSHPAAQPATTVRAAPRYNAGMRPPLLLESIWYLPVRVARSGRDDNLARVLLGAEEEVGQARRHAADNGRVVDFDVDRPGGAPSVRPGRVGRESPAVRAWPRQAADRLPGLGSGPAARRAWPPRARSPARLQAAQCPGCAPVLSWPSAAWLTQVWPRCLPPWYQRRAPGLPPVVPSGRRGGSRCAGRGVHRHRGLQCAGTSARSSKGTARSGAV